jgi:fumarate reductase subunit D
MSEGDLTRFCYSCGREVRGAPRWCSRCGSDLTLSQRLSTQGAAFVLNDLPNLLEAGLITAREAEVLHRHYRSALAARDRLEAPRETSGPQLQQPVTALPQPPPEPARAALPRPAASQPAFGEWLTDQQANLLLYLGAFLILLATIVFVAYSHDQLDPYLETGILVVGTIAFLGAGAFCSGIARVREAGTVFFGVGALLVPLTFAGAYAFIGDEQLNPEMVWLLGSLTTALFYTSVSFTRLGRWYPLPAALALLSSLAASHSLLDVPFGTVSIGLLILMIAMDLPSLVPVHPAREVLGRVWSNIAQVVVLLTVAVLLYAAILEPADHAWVTPVSFAVACGFYTLRALRPQTQAENSAPFNTSAALVLAGVAGVSLVYGAGLPERWGGPALLIVGLVYTLAAVATPRGWFGSLVLAGLSVVFVTASWLALEVVYFDYPGIGAAVHLAAAAYYAVSARWLVTRFEDMAAWSPLEPGASAPIAAAFIYASGLTLSIGYLYLLRSVAGVDVGEAEEVIWPLAGLGGFLAVAGASSRYWWQEARPHLYVMALAAALLAILYGSGVEPDVIYLLAIGTAASLLLALWEREHRALAVPGVFGYPLLLTALTYYEAPDAWLPAALSACAVLLFAAGIALKKASIARQALAPWGDALLIGGLLYALVAPITGWVRLADLVDRDGQVDGTHFERKAIYLSVIGSVIVLGLLTLEWSRLKHRLEFAVLASAFLVLALLLAIGHLNPANIQAYTAPLGLYCIALGVFAARSRGVSREWKELAEPGIAVGAAIIMGPSLLAAIKGDGWAYNAILLAEAVLFVAIALVQRWPRLLSLSIGFITLDAGYLLLFTGRPLPTWALLALAGLVVMAAGTAILLARDRWATSQRTLTAWWYRESPVPPAET